MNECMGFPLPAQMPSPLPSCAVTEHDLRVETSSWPDNFRVSFALGESALCKSLRWQLTLAAAMALIAEKKPMNMGACAKPPSMFVKGLASCFFHTSARRC